MYCKDCKHWKRFSKENPLYEETNEIRGKCSSKKFLDISDYSTFDDDGNLIVRGENDTLEYSDYESYQAYFSTGENFGCVHFERR